MKEISKSARDTNITIQIHTERLNKENSKSVRDTNVTIRLTEILKVHEILT